MSDSKERRKAHEGLGIIIGLIIIALFFLAFGNANAATKSKSSPTKTKTVTRTVVKQKTITKTVVKQPSINLSKQNNRPIVKRQLTYGMYQKGNMVCKVRNGIERCKSRTSYYSDDIYDVDDWFDHDYNHRPQYRQTTHMSKASFGMWSMFMGFIILCAVVIMLFSMRRR